MKVRRQVFVSLATILTFTACGILMRSLRSQPPAGPVGPAATPPAEQTYVGKTKCASCHPKQFAHWKKTKHASDAYSKQPVNYKTEGACLICHSTGFGTASGFKDEASTPDLAGPTCEACHGPGSKHAEAAAPFTNKKPTPEEETMIRGTINKMLPQNVCIRCHSGQIHKEHSP